MMTIMDYLVWRGDVDFHGAPFNEIDNLILSQIVYLHMEGIVPPPGGGGLPLYAVWQAYLKARPDCRSESADYLERDSAKLMEAMAGSRRFGGCLLSAFDHEVNRESEIQFAALTVTLDDGSTYIAYSGTDTSMVGWKENFNMSFLEEIPSQERALRYLRDRLGEVRGPLYVGGHSKGGNLAVYAAMHLEAAEQERLTLIFNNDGPGFTEKMISRRGYQAIRPKLRTFLPQSSIVGLLMTHDEDYRVVHSSSIGPFQHDAFTWEVCGPAFVYREELSRSSLVLDKALKVWLDEIDDDRRRQFVDALFSIVDKAEIEDTDILNHLTWAKFTELIKAADSLSQEDKDVLTGTVRKLIHVYLHSDQVVEQLEKQIRRLPVGKFKKLQMSKKDTKKGNE
ncbi:MAG: DUF2974 domain-containing protein [Lachnospiraceae bacterium]|nr:DUF2974 domain-containing protein [Lachnospiraceae bacterium]